MLLATVMLTPWGWSAARKELDRLTRREAGLLALAGLAMGLHFAVWITSLSYTSVASSVMLVSTSPIWVALAEHFVLHRSMHIRKAMAVCVAMGGSVVVCLGDVGLRGQGLWGNILALIGALAASCYIMLGNELRRKLSTLAYVWPCYGIAAIVLLASAALAGQQLLGYDARTYALLSLLALLPQVIGHSSFNWALAHFTPTFVALATLGEPVGATLLAWLILREPPTLAVVCGGGLIVAAMVLASREEMLNCCGRDLADPQAGRTMFLKETNDEHRLGQQIRPPTRVDDYFGH